MRASLLAAVAAIAISSPARADQTLPARLAGHAILPAATFVLPPADAPRDFLLSGRFTGAGNTRTDAIGTIPGDTGAVHGSRPTGLSLPFIGQPVQGFSGIKPAADQPGTYWTLSDNGFGNRRNSVDSMLMLHRIRPDWATGRVERLETIFLNDAARRVSFRIVTEGTERRYLTGADFDIESIQPLADGSFMLGDEFGPYLIHVSREGQVQRVIDTRLDDAVIQSPDNPAFNLPATPTATNAMRARRSGGFEGMAQTPDGSRLWALLEQPLFRAGSAESEGSFLRMIEFDVRAGQWTGRNLRYRFEQGATSIGDFNMIDDRRALVIERDDGEGDPGRACAQGQSPTGPQPCFPNPARFKRIYLIDLGAADAEGYVRKIAHIDLMNIQDPGNLARQRGDLPANAPANRLTFPFFTIENVAMVDADHIIVGNDNNLPFSGGRHLLRADDNEFILLSVPELLRAR